MWSCPLSQDKVTRIEGGDLSDLIRADYEAAASRLDERLKPWVWTVSEFGFGLNPHARLVGNVLEDEKCLGTCYIAIGDNTRLGVQRGRYLEFRCDASTNGPCG